MNIDIPPKILNVIVIVLSVVLVYVLYKQLSFSTTDDLDKKFKDMSSQMTLMKTDLTNQVTRVKIDLANITNSREMTISRSIYRAPYINVVNRRPIPLVTNIIPWTSSTPETKTALVPYEVYDVFGYNVPAPAPGSKRKWRFYAVWSDTLSQKPGTENIDTFGFFLRFTYQTRVNKQNTNETSQDYNMNFKFYGTCGGHSETRDGISAILELPSSPPYRISHTMLSGWIDGRCTIRCATDSTFPGHASYYTDPNGSLKGGSNGSNAEVKFHYLEFQALDVYE
jgi:hypothetical protein